MSKVQGEDKTAYLAALQVCRTAILDLPQQLQGLPAALQESHLAMLAVNLAGLSLRAEEALTKGVEGFAGLLGACSGREGPRTEPEVLFALRDLALRVKKADRRDANSMEGAIHRICNLCLDSAQRSHVRLGQLRLMNQLQLVLASSDHLLGGAGGAQEAAQPAEGRKTTALSAPVHVQELRGLLEFVAAAEEALDPERGGLHGLAKAQAALEKTRWGAVLSAKELAPSALDPGRLQGEEMEVLMERLDLFREALLEATTASNMSGLRGVIEDTLGGYASLFANTASHMARLRGWEEVERAALELGEAWQQKIGEGASSEVLLAVESALNRFHLALGREVELPAATLVRVEVERAIAASGPLEAVLQERVQQGALRIGAAVEGALEAFLMAPHWDSWRQARTRET